MSLEGGLFWTVQKERIKTQDSYYLIHIWNKEPNKVLTVEYVISYLINIVYLIALRKHTKNKG